MRLLILLFLAVSIATLAQPQPLQPQNPIVPPQPNVSRLSITPQILVFFSGLPQEKKVLLYNFGNNPLRWSLGASSRFLKVDASDVPNPLPPLQGASLKVTVVWDLVPTEAGTIEKPGALIALLEKLLGVDIPDRYKHFGVGLLSVLDEPMKVLHFVTVFTVMY
ncbi:MAG: hypothetical protein N2250_02785 [Pseudothermotoga sp.]|nr:hypothetical protein [Pseudothermotoga sp.]